jgi:hypothetical protein
MAQIAEERKINRLNDKKYTEHLAKGFDLLTLQEIDKEKTKYELKPHYNNWEKLMVDSAGKYLKKIVN